MRQKLPYISMGNLPQEAPQRTPNVTSRCLHSIASYWERSIHWIVASSVGCIEDIVNIYDSLYTSLDGPTKMVVSSLFHARTNMHMQPLQKQVGGTDCGLFAIAVISAIAYGKDPSLLQFKQEEMREHLLNCFKNEYITLFLCS